MVRVKQQLSRNRNHGGSGNRMDYITVHQTANTSRGANAQAHANLIDNGFAATWHYTVDDTQAIQSFYESTICYHAGDGARGPGNNRSIGIELCVNSDGNYNKTVDNAVTLIQGIMKRRNIPLSRVVTHGHWTGKHCPREILNGVHGVDWNEFKRRLAGRNPVTSKPAPVKSSGNGKIVKEIKYDGDWRYNSNTGVWWVPVEATFVVGSEPIYVYERLPKVIRANRAPSRAQPGNKVEVLELCRGNGYEWINYRTSGGRLRYMPIKPWNGYADQLRDGDLWGRFI